MPANLTAQYRRAEDAYRRATTPDEAYRCLQDMLRELPKHKGTEKLQAELKHKISRAKKESESNLRFGKASSVRIPRQGAGQVLVLGGPNAGKSQLVRQLTRATPEVADYPFTTREPTPGMMPLEDVMIQLVDTPPITTDVMEPYLHGFIRAADLALLMVDLGCDDGIEQCDGLLDRLSKTRTQLGTESYLDETDIGLSFTKTFVVANKIDSDGAPERLELLHDLLPLDFREFVISAKLMTGMDVLKNAIFQALDIVRVYTKLPTRKQADRDKPFTLSRGATIADVAALIHKDVAASLRFAKVWGSKVHDGTQVQSDYVLHDKDIVEIHA